MSNALWNFDERLDEAMAIKKQRTLRKRENFD